MHAYLRTWAHYYCYRVVYDGEIVYQVGNILILALAARLAREATKWMSVRRRNDEHGIYRKATGKSSVG